MKHFETKFASTDFKVNFLNLKKIKIFFLEINNIDSLFRSQSKLISEMQNLKKRNIAE